MGVVEHVLDYPFSCLFPLACWLISFSTLAHFFMVYTKYDVYRITKLGKGSMLECGTPVPIGEAFGGQAACQVIL